MKEEENVMKSQYGNVAKKENNDIENVKIQCETRINEK